MSDHNPGSELDLDAKVARYSRIVCPTHGIPDCSPMLNGCTVPAYLNRAGEDVRALVAEVRRLRALSDRLREQLQHECPHGEMSWSGLDQTPLEDPAEVWVCDNCGKVLDAQDER